MSLDVMLYGLPLSDLIMLLPIAFAFGGEKPPKPPPPIPPPARTDTGIQDARARARLAQRKRRGRSSTILGGEQEDVVAAKEKELLGG